MFPIPEPGTNALRSREVERTAAAVVGSLRAGDLPASSLMKHRKNSYVCNLITWSKFCGTWHSGQEERKNSRALSGLGRQACK